MRQQLLCPSCGGSADIIGHEVRGIYDGILAWSHPECGWAWPADFETGSYREARARDHAERLKAEFREEQP